jgi:hypothetical protein
MGESGRGRARMMESAMQSGAWGYLRQMNNGNFAKAFRVMFPSLPENPSQKAIAAAIDAAESAQQGSPAPAAPSATRSDSEIAKWTDILAKHGEKGRDRLRGYLASLTLGRDFQEPVADYLERQGLTRFDAWAMEQLKKPVQESTPAPPAAPREPWQMTARDYNVARAKELQRMGLNLEGIDNFRFLDEHKAAVEAAVAVGSLREIPPRIARVCHVGGRRIGRCFGCCHADRRMTEGNRKLDRGGRSRYRRASVDQVHINAAYDQPAALHSRRACRVLVAAPNAISCRRYSRRDNALTAQTRWKVCRQRRVGRCCRRWGC